MPNPVEVKSLEKNLLYVKYDDGLEGQFDVTRVKRKENIFCAGDCCEADAPGIDEKTGDIKLKSGITLCKNALYRYLELKNMAFKLGLDESKL